MIAGIVWRSLELWPVALALLALIVAAVVLLYPPQVRRLPPRRRWMLPALRGIAVGALALSVLRPVLLRGRSVEEEGVVVVVMDRSMSMGVLDRVPESNANRSAAVGQLVALADGLGRLPPGVRSQSMTDVYRDIQGLQSLLDEIARNRREVEFARLSGREPPEQRLQQSIDRFIEAARAAAQRAKAAKSQSAEPLSRIAQRPRLDRENWFREISQTLKSALDEAQETQDSIDNALYEGNASVRAECDRLSRMSRFALSWQAAGAILAKLDPKTPVEGIAIGQDAAPLALRDAGGQFTPEPPVPADDAASDLSGGIARALQQSGRRNVQAVVLFSDGRQVGARGGVPSALLPSGVPVFTVDAASAGVRDLSIDRIDLPRSLFVDESLPAHVVMRCLNMDARRVSGDVRMSVSDWPPTMAPLKLAESKPLQSVELPPLRLVEPGLHRVVIALPYQRGEADVMNNQSERWVKVLSQRLKVTALSGSPGWDFRYLRNALSRTPWVELREAVVVPGSTSLAMSPQEILQQDLVILNDLPTEALSPDQWEAIRRLVADRGGSAILIPGLTLRYQQDKPHPLAALLPYPASPRPAWRTWPGQTPQYHVSPTGGELPLDDDPEASRQRWDDLPAFYRYLYIPQLRPTARPLLVERESRQPLLTEDHHGAGRVFFLATSETWRWRRGVGDRDHDRFWLQLVRYAADEPYAVVRGAMSFDIDLLAAEPDEAVRVRARIGPGDPPASLPPSLQVDVVRDGQLIRTLPLQPAGRGAGRYVSFLGGLPPGEYQLRLICPSGEAPLELPLRVESSPQREMADVSGDNQFLQNLADASGGRYLKLEQAGQIPDLLREARQRRPRLFEWRLWDSGSLFLFVLGCLTAEWALRKRWGLA